MSIFRRENNPSRQVTWNTADAGGHVRFRVQTAHMIPEDVKRFNVLSERRAAARSDREGILRKGEAEAATKRQVRKGTPFEAKSKTVKIDSSKTMLGKEIK